MHVDQTHEDGHHEAAVVEVFILFHFFDDYHLAVGRRYHHFLRILTEETYRATEEVDQYAVHH